MRKKTWNPSFLFILITLVVLWIAPHSPFQRSRIKDKTASTSETQAKLPPRLHASRTQTKSEKKNVDAREPRAQSANPMQAAQSLPSANDSSTATAPSSGEPESELFQDALAERLARATSNAAKQRPFAIDRSVIETALTQGTARILFDDSDGTASKQLAALKASDLRDFPLLDTGAATVAPEVLAALIEETNTQRIELDLLHRPTLAFSVPLVGADVLHAIENEGDGFAVAVLDTGIDHTHPVFAGRILEEACFSSEEQCPNGRRTQAGVGAAAPCAVSGCGHGTHVAGIAVGDDPGGMLTGVAPGASVIAIQIFSEVDGEPGAYSSDILAGMQHVLALSDIYPIASVNLSFGSGEYTSHCDSARAMFSAVSRLRDVGIATVAASGNDALTDSVSLPACLSNVISVGSTNDDDRVSSFSNASSNLSMLAPGRSIRSAAVGGGSIFSSGTSMAAPHVAGAIALLREAYPNATVGEMENALLLSGQPVLDDRNGITYPRLRVDEAHTLLASASSESPGTDPPAPELEEEDEGPAATASPKSGGGGGSCGLVGIEPFFMLGLIRGMRRLRGMRSRAFA